MRKSGKDQEQKDDRGPGELSSFNNRKDNRTGSIEDVKGKEKGVAKAENEAGNLQENARDKKDQMEA